MIPTPEELKVAWNENRGRMLTWTSLDVNGRRELAKKRLAEVQDLSRWVFGIRRAANSDFLTGKIFSDAQEPFVAGPDWLLKPGTLTLIEEGQFDNRRVEPPESASPADLSYFDAPIDRTKLTPEEIKECQRRGEELKKLERQQHRKLQYEAAP